MSGRPRDTIGNLRLAAVLALASAASCGGIASHAGGGGTARPDGGTLSSGGTPPPDGGTLSSGGTLPDAGAPSSGDSGPGAAWATRAASCPATPPLLQAGGTVITFQTDPFLGGQPMIYGQPNALPGGGTLTPLNLRFFLSNVALVGTDGSLVAVDLVTSTGMMERYGVHLFNAEDPATTAWSIRAPAGSYGGIKLIFGLSDACNATDYAISTDSQMTWPSPFGYLFLRYEGRIDGVGPDGGLPSDGDFDGGVGPLAALPAIGMGGIVGRRFAPVVHIDGPLAVPSSGPVLRHLRFDMDQVFKGATANISANIFPAPPALGLGLSEMLAGERLRQTAPQLPIFVLDP